MASPSMASSFFNGERAIVLVFIFLVHFSTPLPLLREGFALSLLALAALAVEISADDYDSLAMFKTRPGSSSGILLGAVTLPALMITRLIQLLRAFSSHGIGIEEFEYLKMQYWATFFCCFSVILFLCLVIWCSPYNACSSSLHSIWDLKIGSIRIILYAALCCVSLAMISYYYGVFMALKPLWLLFHGLAAVKLIQQLLKTFPSCASIGEALLVTGGLVLYFGDMLTFTIAKIHGYLVSSELVLLPGIKRNKISTIIQGLLLGLLLFPVVFKFVLQIWEWLRSSTYSEERTNNEFGKSLIFYATLTFIVFVIIPSWMQFIQDFHVHPYLWVFMFVFSEPLKRLTLCLYWMGVTYASVMRFYNISKNSKIERILLRKYYHLMAVSMFLPALIFQPKFLDLAFGAALAVFLALESIRVWRVWPLGQLVHQFMNAFTDHRDSDLLIVSHFSLLLGCALPIWMSSGYNDRPLAPFAGILSLGIGDTMASVVGHKYGVLRWSKTGSTAAGITSVLAACSVILPLIASTSYILSQHWISLLLAVTVSGLLEAYTTQLDNAFIPLIFYSLLCL
ncbi:dolichol kinase EVAN isoform X2 [Malania oleifera]|uniref:dolichol kinase EVAN isoform X2 n=1 Tax=Malania oleifera TaxID=397392 RepID=UPI0025AE090A|nr:dolichol kinase EVAN isoform X2 [Malania oleifera]